ncbi:hypothetical protein NHX12_023948, partial [Muraenolepis orangiensis]
MADVWMCGAPRPGALPPPAGRPRKSNTYLAMIACVLQDAPGKMLTFTQLMEKLEEFVTGDRKRFENNIRVCLSSSKCFVKIPMFPRMAMSKNYWKLDLSHITAKMMRRHFKEIPDKRWPFYTLWSHLDLLGARPLKRRCVEPSVPQRTGSGLQRNPMWDREAPAPPLDCTQDAEFT